MRHRFTHSPIIRAALVAIVAGLAAGPAVAQAQGPQTETVYLDGHTATINTGAAVVFDASAGLLQQTSPIYIIGFPVSPGTTGPITLPSGYEPQHNGFPPSPIPYHDHVLGGASVPRRVVEMRYSWDYAYNPAFVPITSADQISAAEAAGRLELINPGAPDPYQVWTTTVLIRPLHPGL